VASGTVKTAIARQVRGASVPTGRLGTEDRVKEPHAIEVVHHADVPARRDGGRRIVPPAEARLAEIATGREWAERAIPPKRWVD
jgi:hypothetical protein